MCVRVCVCLWCCVHSTAVEFMSSRVKRELCCRGCVTESHQEREGLGDNAGVCATAPDRRLAHSDRSRLTTVAAHIVEVKIKVDSFILSAGCIDKGEPPPTHIFLIIFTTLLFPRLSVG